MSRKAAGPDKIPAEALKSDKEATVKIIHVPFGKIWHHTTDSTSEGLPLSVAEPDERHMQGRAWWTADRCISTEDRRQTRLSTLSLPLSSGDRLNYEDLDIREKTRNTMDSSEPIRRFGPRR
ncbi:unnamed protein product [Schistosoma curassoni]|uniref:Uncharacterized protein n=1 Tax=Schistosoma curassoni TaxID=6186 RepID=A0A183JM22_9TREM|nr:unnamed protein product [Schistosoma curassoni]